VYVGPLGEKAREGDPVADAPVPGEPPERLPLRPVAGDDHVQVRTVVAEGGDGLDQRLEVLLGDEPPAGADEGAVGERHRSRPVGGGPDRLGVDAVVNHGRPHAGRPQEESLPAPDVLGGRLGDGHDHVAQRVGRAVDEVLHAAVVAVGVVLGHHDRDAACRCQDSHDGPDRDRVDVNHVGVPHERVQTAIRAGVESRLALERHHVDVERLPAGRPKGTDHLVDVPGGRLDAGGDLERDGGLVGALEHHEHPYRVGHPSRGPRRAGLTCGETRRPVASRPVPLRADPRKCRQ